MLNDESKAKLCSGQNYNEEERQNLSTILVTC